MQGKEGFAFAGEGEIGVVIDTHITQELREEGYVREILSKVQNMRKDKGFEVLDKINLYVSGNEMLENVVRQVGEVGDAACVVESQTDALVVADKVRDVGLDRVGFAVEVEVCQNRQDA